MIPALRNGELDLIVNYGMPQPPEGVVSEYLYADDQLVCASTKHRLAGRSRLKIADLEDEQWALSEPTLEFQRVVAGTVQRQGAASNQDCI